MLFPPTQPMTPGGWKVLIAVLFLVSLALGALCLWLGYRAPANQAQNAATVIRGGYGCLVFAGIIAVGIVLYRRSQ